jgi:hypothetical protein
LNGYRVRRIIRERNIAQQGCPVVFEQFGGILVAGEGGRRRHLRLTELRVIECFQTEGQSSLRAGERSRTAHDNLLKI